MADTPPEPEEREGRLTLRARLHRFFFPSPAAPRWERLLPYGVLGLVSLLMLTGGAFAWEYTNSPAFCGESCHTMPPEYAAYQVSPHARVDCVDCHIGKGFIATRITRKAGDVKHIVYLAFRSYELPIYAGEMRPASQTCERCHYPAKFSDDSLRQIVHFRDDEENSWYTIYLALRTGGGSSRQGLGRGIHWHVENEVYFVATDRLQQDIPYIRVVKPDGTEDVYLALDSEMTRAELEAMPQERIDCMTCHNRITHNILTPERAVDGALSRGQINREIPFIRARAVEVLSAEYETDDEARAAIRGLMQDYADEYPEVYRQYRPDIQAAVELLVTIYDQSVFRELKVDWYTHPNNLGHRDWPGCFRCHDGQHANDAGEVVRLECNLCHSIPQVAEAGAIEPTLPLATGVQPESHFSTLWIAMHRDAFDSSCQACHTVTNPGGTDNTSFCSNSACHGTAWEFAGLDAPGLSELIARQQPEPAPEQTAEAGEQEPAATDEPGAGPTAAPEPAGDPTWDGEIGAIFGQKCASCHSAGVATGGLVLETFAAALAGGESGPVIVPGDADGSRLVQIQREGHFAQLTDDELERVIAWILAGAPER